MHLILLHHSPLQQMNIPRYIYLLLHVSRTKGPLLTTENVEVIVQRVQAGVSFGTEGCSGDDEVFGNGGVNDVHGAHCAAGIVEYPFFGVWVERDSFVIPSGEAMARGGEEGGREGVGGAGRGRRRRNWGRSYLRVLGSKIFNDVGYYECCVWSVDFDS